MRKLLYAKDSDEFWQIFNEEREKRRKKLARLPFAKKVAILEKMQADMNSAAGFICGEGRKFELDAPPGGFGEGK